MNIVIQNFFIYVVGALLVGGFHLILAPINMRILSPGQYGVLALITSSIAIGATLLGFGLRQLLSIEYFHQDELGQKKFINKILLLYVMLATPICLALLLLYAYLAPLLAEYHISFGLFALTLITTFLSFFAELFYQIMKYQQRAWILMCIQTAIALTSLSITVALLLIAHWGVLSTVIGQCASMCAATSIGFYFWRQQKFAAHTNLDISSTNSIELLKRSIPFVPSILFAWIIASSDRFVLAKYASMHDVGIYAIADIAGQMFRLLILQSWSGSYLPSILLEYQKNKDNLLAVERKNLRIMWLVMGGLALFILMGFIVAKPLLLIVLPSDYHGALNYMLIIVAGHIFLLGSYFAASFIQYHKRTYFLATAFCLPALLNLIFNLLLVHRFKIYGCTVATLLAYGIYFLIILGYNYRLQKYEHKPCQ